MHSLFIENILEWYYGYWIYLHEMGMVSSVMSVTTKQRHKWIMKPPLSSTDEFNFLCTIMSYLIQWTITSTFYFLSCPWVLSFSHSLSKAISVMHFSVFMHPAYLFPLSDIMTKLNHKWYTQNENTYHIRCLNSLFLVTLLEDLPLGIMLITLHVQKCRLRIKGLVLACL